MKNRLLAAGATALALVAGGLGALAVAAPASAHTPTLSATCSTGVTVDATNYDPGVQNRWTIKINNTLTSGVFGASTHQNVAFPQGGATSTYTASIDAPGTQYDKRISGKVGPCGTIPADATAAVNVSSPTCDLPGVPTINATNAVSESLLDTSVGTHTIEFFPTQGHQFPNGQKSVIVTYTVPAATGYQSTDPEGLCYTAPHKTPVVGTASITVTPPTCTVPTNGLTVVVPTGLTVNGFTAGTYTAEQIAEQAGLKDIYHAWTVPVNVADGYTYDGPATLTFNLIDPATLDCSGPQPEAKVTYTEWKDSDNNCTLTQIVETRDQTTTPYVKVDGKWVPDTENAVTVQQVQQRDKTDAEIEACAVVVPPTTTPKPTPTPTPTPSNTPKPVVPAAVQHAGHTPAPAVVKATPAPVAADTLAYTGSQVNPWVALWAALAAALGLATLVLLPRLRHRFTRHGE